MERLAKRKCVWCAVWFAPDHRLKDRQKTCGGSACKRQQNLAGQRRWKRREREDYRRDQRDWRKGHPDYWREYRERHPVYTERNRIQSRIRWSLARRTLQKKLDILEVAEKSVKYWNVPRFAKHPRSLFPLLFAYEAGRERSQGHPKSQSP